MTENGLSCRDLVAYYLQNIREKQHLNAFLEVDASKEIKHDTEPSAKDDVHTK